MKQRIIHLIGALAIILAVAGSGYETGVHLAGTVDVVAPQDASAACTIAIGAPAWHVSGYQGSMSASGCGTVTLQACLQNTAGTVYGCHTWSGSGASARVWSSSANYNYGWTQRTWGLSNIYGTCVSAYRILC